MPRLNVCFRSAQQSHHTLRPCSKLGKTADKNPVDPMQLVDELSMIYTTCLMMYASFSYSRSRYFATVFGLGLVALAGSITVSIRRP